ncbi:MAG: class I SAM-dependent methyltransferase [Deltaproteobacteria bacterium]|nr:class I SAM-dependent methyltransferase [Deltaproteobacteria bacterium]
MTDYFAKDRYRGTVAERYNDERAGSKWELEQRVMERALDDVPRGSSVLDVPLGTGRYLPFYAHRGHRVVGLDISTDMLREARHANVQVPLSPIRGDVTAIPLRSGAVDYVVSTRLMNWLPEVALFGAVEEMARVASKGVILGIREIDRLELGQVREAVTELVRAPRKSLKRLLRPLRGNSIVLHSSAVVHAAFARAKLRVIEMHLIEEDTAFSRRLFHYAPLRTYVLRPS